MVEAEDLCFPALCLLKAVTSKCICLFDAHVYQLTEGEAPLMDVLYAFAKWVQQFPAYLSWGISFAFGFMEMPCSMGAAAQEGCISPALSNVMGACWGQTSLKRRLSDWADSVQMWSLHQDQTHSRHRGGPVPFVAHGGTALGMVATMASISYLIPNAAQRQLLPVRGGKEGVHLGSSLSSWFCHHLAWGSAGRWKVAGRGCIACWAGGHHHLSLKPLPSLGGIVFCLPAGTVLGEAFSYTEYPHSDLLWVPPVLVKTCTEQQRHRGQRNSETFLESSEALQVWILWEDSKETATSPCTTSYHTLVTTPSFQVMARSCLVPLAGAVSGCVDPSHKAARKTCVICFGVCNLSASWTRKKFDICLALHLYIWVLLMPVSPNVWVTRQGVWICSVQKFFCSLFCELFVYEVGGKHCNSQWWGDSATGFPVLSAVFFRLARWGVGVSSCITWLQFAHSQRKRAEWRLLAVITIIKFRKGHALWNVFLKALVTGC